MDCVGADSISQRRQQQRLQLTAVHRVLRIAVAAVDAARLAVQKRAVGVVVGDRRGRNGDPRQFTAEPEFVELAYGVWQQVDAHAQRAKVGAFDDGCVDAAGVQCDRSGQSADSGPGNQKLL